MWETVAVRTVDEEEERKRLEEQERDLELDRTQAVRVYCDISL